MTNLEISLIVIFWIGYGAFAAYQTDGGKDTTDYIMYIILSPLVFFTKAIYGIFKRYKTYE